MSQIHQQHNLGEASSSRGGSYRIMELSERNGKLAFLTALISSVITLSAIFLSFYFKEETTKIAGVPYGEKWEWPMVHFINSPIRYEEDAKPVSVALKYVRGLYEVDVSDFIQIPDKDRPMMLSQRAFDLLYYTVPGSDENTKVAKTLQESQSLYKLYEQCRCVKRFLISDVIITQSVMPIVRVEVIGRFVIFGIDGMRPLPSEDLGFKSIVLSMTNNIPQFKANSSYNFSPEVLKAIKADIENKESLGIKGQGENLIGGDKSGPRHEKQELTESINPEGWYIIRSSMITLTPENIKEIRKVRQLAGMKAIY